MRRQRGRPILEALELWLREKLALVSQIGRIVNGHPQRPIDDLLPWAYRHHRHQSRGVRTPLTMVKLTAHESLSRETVRRRLVENDLEPWRKKMWCIPQVDAEYVARMEDVLDLYAEEPNRNTPVTCFDESPIQLIGEVRRPIPAEPGQIERYDCEYRRNGTADLLVFLDANRSWRKVKVTERRTAQDFVACMREITDIFSIPRPSAFGWCWTICRPIRPARSARPSRPIRRGGCCAGLSSTTSPSTPAG